MKFEEMQDIWKGQEEEQLFDVDRQALNQAIKRKGRSVARWLELLEWMLIVVNFVVAIYLLVHALQESGPAYHYIVVALYIGYAVYAMVRRLSRRRTEIRFEETVRGEVDKALWQVDQIIRWGRALPLWYLLPLALVGAMELWLRDTQWWKAALLLLVVPASYVGVRWEIEKWHLPKKRALQSLREELLAFETARPTPSETNL